MTKLNGLLAILVLLHGAVSFERWSKMFLPPDDEFATLSTEEFIERWNDRRRVFAIEDNIADMTMLSYSTKIEEIVKNMTHDCSNITTETPFRWFLTGGNEVARNYEADMFEQYRMYNFREEDKEKYIIKTALFVEALNPSVRLIGCAKYPCLYNEWNGGIPHIKKYTALCLVGAATKETLMDRKFGWPGSACRNKGANIAGLCKQPIVKNNQTSQGK